LEFSELHTTANVDGMRQKVRNWRSGFWQTAFWYRGGGIPGEPGTSQFGGHVDDPAWTTSRSLLTSRTSIAGDLVFIDV